MPRINLIRLTRVPYHVTIKTYQNEFFKIPLSDVWEFALIALKEANQLYPIHLIAFVLMGNHYHLILVTPNANLDQFMFEFNRKFAQQIKRKSKQVNPIFGGRYKWSLIRSVAYFSRCYCYVYQNPVRAKIVSRVEDYPYSTLYYIVRGESFPVPIHDKFGFKDLFNLHLLNRHMTYDESEKIRKDLKKYLGPRN